MIITKRWKDQVEPEDGLRLFVCRYWPRGLKKNEAPWDDWWKSLAPSRELHADWYGKRGKKISLSEFRERFLVELENPASQDCLSKLTELHKNGEIVTLLCYCEDETRCHRTILKELVLERVGGAR